jgi:hypothetical protein
MSRTRKVMAINQQAMCCDSFTTKNLKPILLFDLNTAKIQPSFSSVAKKP